MPKNKLEIWTIYKDPKDFPGKYVARKFLVGIPAIATGDHFVCNTLEECRNHLPGHLACITRAEGDEPHIVESWL